MKNSTPLFSVIIPVYNAAEFVPECALSVLHQTFRDLELILVDDGSVDESLSICYKLAEIDSRVVVVHQDNQGVSAARNKGLSYAHGKYIFFMDSDDKLDSTLFYDVKDSLSNIDLLILGFSVDYVGKNNQVYSQIVSYDEFFFELPKHSYLLSSYLPSGFLNPLWNKIFRADIIKEHHISFEPYQIEEDMLFVASYLYHSRSVLILPNHYYHYMKRPVDSLSLKADIGMLNVFILAHERLLKVFFQALSVPNVEKAMFAQYYGLLMKLLRKVLRKQETFNDVRPWLQQIMSNPKVRHSFRYYKPSNFNDYVIFTLARFSFFRIVCFLLSIKNR